MSHLSLTPCIRNAAVSLCLQLKSLFGLVKGSEILPFTIIFCVGIEQDF